MAQAFPACLNEREVPILWGKNRPIVIETARLLNYEIQKAVREQTEEQAAAQRSEQEQAALARREAEKQKAEATKKRKAEEAEKAAEEAREAAEIDPSVATGREYAVYSRLHSMRAL